MTALAVSCCAGPGAEPAHKTYTVTVLTQTGDTLVHRTDVTGWQSGMTGYTFKAPDRRHLTTSGGIIIIEY